MLKLKDIKKTLAMALAALVFSLPLTGNALAASAVHESINHHEKVELRHDNYHHKPAPQKVKWRNNHRHHDGYYRGSRHDEHSATGHFVTGAIIGAVIGAVIAHNNCE